MKKVEIDKATYWYNHKTNTLFYDRKGTRQTPVNIFDNFQYAEFLKQIATK